MSYLEVQISDGVTSSFVAQTSGPGDTVSPVTAATTQVNFGFRSGGSGGPVGGSGITGDMTLTATVNGVPEPIIVAGVLQSGWTSNPPPSAYNAGTSYSPGDFVYHPTSATTYTANGGPGTLPTPPDAAWDAGPFAGHYEYGGWNYVIARDTPWPAGASVVIDASGDGGPEGVLSCSGSFTVEGGAVEPTTLAEALVGPGFARRAYFTIQGLPQVFCQHAEALALETEDGRYALSTIEDWPEVGEEAIDYEQRRINGGTFACKLFDTATDQLRALFSPRSRRVAYLVADASKTATSMQLSASSALTDGSGPGIIYIDGETITYTDVDGTDLVGCVRGCFGSEAQVHFGGSENGASVFLVPPAYCGRRVKLYVYHRADDGRDTVTTALRLQVGTYRLDNAPRSLGAGRWEVSGSPLSAEVAAKKLGSGLRDRADGRIFANVFGGDVFVTFGEGTADFDAVGTRFSFLMGDMVNEEGDDAGKFVLPIIGVYSASVLQCGPTNLVVGGNPIIANGTIKSCRHIVVVDNAPSQLLAAYLLLSRLGDGTNGSGLDVLPGLDALVEGGPSYRVGAGILEAEFDYATFARLSTGANQLSAIVDDVISVGEFLDDYCLCTETLWCCTRAGLLSLKTLNEDVSTSAMTIDRGMFRGLPEVAYDDDAIVPRAKLKANYNPVSKDFDASINNTDVGLVKRYPNRGDTVEMESRLLCVSPAPAPEGGSIRRSAQSPAAVEVALRSYQAQGLRGRCLVTLDECDPLCLTLEVGDVVTIGSDVDEPAFDGTSIAGRLARVARVRPNLKATTVGLTLEVLERLYFVGSGAICVSNAGPVLTLATGAPESASSSTPGRLFAVTWQVMVSHLATDTHETFDVDAVADTTITLSGTPSFTVAAGDTVKVTSTTTAAENATGYGDDDFVVEVGNDEYTADIVTRWR